MNAVPTMKNLHRRKLNKSASCPICNMEAETIEHALLLCPWVECVWFGSPLSLSFNKAGITTLDLWIMSFLNSQLSSCEKRKLLSMISFFLWAIWKSRCAFIYRGSAISPRGTISDAIDLYTDFCEVQSQPTNHRMLPMPGTVWSPPLQSFIKINCDASWNKALNVSGIGCVLRDSMGSFCAGSRRSTFLQFSGGSGSYCCG